MPYGKKSLVKIQVFFWNVQNCLEQQKFHVRHLWCSIETGGGTPSRRSSFECRDCRYFNEHVFVF